MNQGLKEYWNGWKAAKEHICRCGRDSAFSEHYYGLQGKPYPYTKGWLDACKKAVV